MGIIMKQEAEEVQKESNKGNYPNSSIFYAWFSCAGFFYFMIALISRASRDKNPLIIPNNEMSICVILLIIVLIAQTLSLKLHHDKTLKRKYVLILTIIYLLWLISNMFFYFSSKPFFIFLFLLLVSVGICLHPSFQSTYTEQCLNFTLWISNRKGFISSLLKLPIKFLFFKYKSLRLYYSNDGTMFLLYLIFISLFCLFAIMGKAYIAAIIILFFILNIKIIANFKPPAFWKPRKSKKRSKFIRRSVADYYEVSTLSSLHITQPLGSTAFIFVFIISKVYLKLPFPFQLTVWGVCLWNLVMSEIFLYARNLLEEIKIRFKEYDDLP
jgi:hypothetical protein